MEIVNNTTYQNGQVVGYADIMVDQCTDVKVLNNIAYSPKGARPIQVIRGSDVLVDYNLSFNGSEPPIGPNDMLADPQFVAPSTEWGLADFHPADGSPAAGTGDRTKAPADDLEGNPRSSDQGAAKGALEPRPKPPDPDGA